MKNTLLVLALCLFSKHVLSQSAFKKYPTIPLSTTSERINSKSENLISASAAGSNKIKSTKSAQKKSVGRIQTSSIASHVELISLGKSSNAYTLVDNPWMQVISFDPKSGVVVLVRRGGSLDNISLHPGNSLFYDYSSDGGNTWDVGLGPIYKAKPSPNGTLPYSNGARYPMGVLINPKKSSNPQNVYGFFSSGALAEENGTWGGETFGIRRIATNDTSTLRLQTNALINKPEATSANSAGQVFVVQKEVDLSGSQAVYNNILKISRTTIDTLTHQFSRTESTINLPEDAPTLNQTYSGTNICFAKSGGIGYITLIARMASQQFCPLPNSYLIVYKTSDNGTTWTGPHVADLTYDSDFSPIRDVILGDSASYQPTNQFERVYYSFTPDFDSEVDVNGDLHYFGTVAASPNSMTQTPGVYYPKYLGLVHFSAGFAQLNSNSWTCHFARRSPNEYGFIGENLFTNSVSVKFFPQISFSEDRDQMLLSYCETDTVQFPALDLRYLNNHPNLYVRKGKFQNDHWSFGFFENVTGETDLSGLIYWPRMANTFKAIGDSVEFFVSTCIIDDFPLNTDISLVEISHQVLHFNGKSIIGLNTATGRVFHDLNQNCIFDSTDVPLFNQIVRIVPGNLFSFTDSAGNFHFDLGAGTYKIQAKIPYSQSLFISAPCLTNLSSAPFTFSSDSGGTVIGIPIPIKIKQCAHLDIKSYSTILRPCRSGTYTITIKNNGTVAAENIKVHIKLPPLIKYVSSNANLTYNATDTSYSALISTLGPNQSFTISISDSLICSTNPAQLLGIFQCFLSKVTYQNGCPPIVPGWDGTDLIVSGKCSGNVRFKIKNTGATMNAPRDFRIFKDSLFVFQQSFQLGFGDSAIIVVPNSSNASIYRIEVPQSLNHPNGPFASASTTCIIALAGASSVMASDDVSENSSQFCEVIRISYDPNDKQVWPPGAGPEGKTLPHSWFNYKIRFMNKGNDTAFKVIVVDSLSNDLDFSTFTMGLTSHPCKVKLGSGNSNVLSFIFDPIQLVDSTTNTPGSQGFIQFRIKAKENTVLGTTIKNRAYIYFDFNEAILTNYTTNTLFIPGFSPGVIDSVQVIASIMENINKELFFELYPNPGESFFKIHTALTGMKTFSLTDIMGRKILEGRFNGEEQRVDVKELRQGTYLFNLKSSDAIETRKFIKN